MNSSPDSHSGGGVTQRVCYVSHYRHMRMGGQRSMVALISRLDRSRYEPVAVTPGPGELTDHLEQLGCRVFHVPLCPIKPKLFLQVARNVRRMRKLFKAEQIDIVHPDAERDAFVCGLACRSMPTKLVWHVRLTRSHHLDKLNTGFADAVIGISEGVRQRFNALPGLEGKYHTVYNGVDLEIFRPVDDRGAARAALGLPRTGFTLVFVGQLKRGKGIFDLAAAIEMLRARGLSAQQFRCLMIGAAADEATAIELSHDITARGIADYVSVLPQQDNIQQWMQAADALILPSHEGVEGMGRVLFEAMACGTIAIGSNISGVKDAITADSGVLVEAESPAAIAAAVENLVNSESERERLVRGGLERARSVFSIQRHAESVQRIYDSLQTRAEVVGL